jgi:hypothetical protein
MRPRLILIVSVVLCGLFSAPETASADDAAKAFLDGVELYEKKDCNAALPLLRQAHQATNSPNARLYIARCLLELGQLSEAYDEMKTTVSEATARADKEPKYAPTRNSAAAELAILDQKVGKLMVAISDPPEGTTVNVNDWVLAPDRWGRPVAIEPGKQTIVVKAPGKQTETRAVVVAAGQLKTLALSLRDEGGDEAPPKDIAPKPDQPSETAGGEVRTVGFVIGALGLVGVGVGAGLAAKAKSDFDGIDEECGSATCPAEFQGRVDDGRSMQLGANIALIAGGALAATGAAMVIFGGPHEVGAESAAITPLPGGGLFTIGGRF